MDQCRHVLPGTGGLGVVKLSARGSAVILAGLAAVVGQAVVISLATPVGPAAAPPRPRPALPADAVNAAAVASPAPAARDAAPGRGRTGHTGSAGRGQARRHAQKHSAPGGSSALGSSQTSLVKQDVGGTELASSGVVVRYPATGVTPLPSVPASAYVIANARTGQVLAAKDAHGLFPPASTLKMLTAITLIPRLNPNASVLASRQAATTAEYDVGLVAGRRYKVSDLFRALLLISANDAAVALTQATGSLTQGMALINAEAHRLQAYDVEAKLPNGLPATGQVTSAYDQALIAQRALAMPAFMNYDSTQSARFPVTPKNWVPLVNQNKLLTQYRGGIGGKIGWTEAAGATYIGMARRNGVTLIVTVLHCTPLQEITAGEQLLDWGFAMNGKVRPVGQLVSPLPAVAAGHARALPAKPQPASGGMPAVPVTVAAGLIAAALLAAGWFTRRRRLASVGQQPPDQPPAS
jgi:D-alanyl-D-alanine carboxypeptidase (penicillin-binding protein 5/6)